MSKDKKNFRCTDAKTCMFTFTSESAIFGPEPNTNLKIVHSEENKVVKITVENSANFTLFSAKPINTIAEKSGIHEIKIKTTPANAELHAVSVNVPKPRTRAPVVEDDEKQTVFPDRETADLESEQCKAVNKYRNYNNSCYIDSVLFALFAFPTEFVRHYILDRNVQEIRDELRRKKLNDAEKSDAYKEGDLDVIIPYITKIQQVLNNIFRRGNNQRLNSIGSNSSETENLRSILRNSYNGDLFTEMNLGTYTEEDVAEFIRILFDVFNINNITKNETQTFKSTVYQNIKEEERVKTDAQPPIYKIEQTILDELRKPTEIFNLSGRHFHVEFDERNYVNNESDEKVFNIRDTIDNFQIVPSTNNHFMILQIPRFYYDLHNEESVKTTQKIYPPLHVRINHESPLLELNQIIVHIGRTPKQGHYATYFKCNHKWYLYNDTEGISFVGTYTQLLDHKVWGAKLKNNAYLLFYSNADTSKPK